MSELEEIYSVFRQYPDVFGGGYMKYLKSSLKDILEAGTYLWQDGCFLAWHIYKVKVRVPDSLFYMSPGSMMLRHFVTKSPGDGSAHKVMGAFLERFGRKKVYLKVLASNARALRFYEGYEFQKVCDLKFGRLDGILLLRDPDRIQAHCSSECSP